MNIEFVNPTVEAAPMLACGSFGPGAVALLWGIIGGVAVSGLMAFGNLFLIASRCRSTASIVFNYGLLAACLAAVYQGFTFESASQNPFQVLIVACAIVISQFMVLVCRRSPDEA